MEEMNLDLYLAIAKGIEGGEDEAMRKLEKVREEGLMRLKYIEQEIEDAFDLEIEKKTFFDSLFSIYLPSSLIKEEIKEGNLLLYRCKTEQLSLTVKLVSHSAPIDLESVKKTYKEQMIRSRQQTEFCLSESRQVNGIQVSYFSASHTMPEQKQFNYLILFKIRNNTIIFDFNIREERYSYWAIIIYALIGTIQEGDYE